MGKSKRELPHYERVVAYNENDNAKVMDLCTIDQFFALEGFIQDLDPEFMLPDLLTYRNVVREYFKDARVMVDIHSVVEDTDGRWYNDQLGSDTIVLELEDPQVNVPFRVMLDLMELTSALQPNGVEVYYRHNKAYITLWWD